MDNGSSIKSERIAIVAIEVGGEGASSLISKVISQRRELPFVVFSFLELLLD